MKSLVLFVSLFAATGFAADNSSKMTIDTGKSTVENPAGFVPFVGAGVGYMGQNNTLQTGGTPSSIKILGSYYFAAPIVADLGVGMMNQQFNQTENAKAAVSGENYELAGRYKFENRWQAGAIVNAFGGNSDRYGSSDSQLTTFAGVQALKEFTITKELLLRAGARVMTDLNIRDEQVNVGMIDLELGWITNKTSAPEQVTEKQTETPAETRSVAQTEDKNTVTYPLDAEKFHFATGRADIEKNEAKNLQSLSAVLAKNAGLFEKVEVVGHADQTGPDAFNQKLSDNRAHTVAANLLKSGLGKARVKTIAKGESEPLIDSLQPEALRQNRRVEIKFIGVKDQAALERALSSIK
jgi:OOP family OmpA-OmpF porin